MTIRAVVLADTHVRAGRPRRLPEAAYRLLDRATVILHAGDVVDDSLLSTLSSIAPTYAVLGNNDQALTGALPTTRQLEFDGVPVAMVHDSGPRPGRAGRLHRRFPDAAVVVFGHSHIPVDEGGLDGQQLFNPGSPTERRSQPHHTVGVLDLADGRVRDHRIVVVGP
ncbi:MAG TPA: metallophosphoesterase family protein [Acidimicrobiales bacterium]|nr:metallophosphoesterase family protein [Acidimicrobiales bacterium]